MADLVYISAFKSGVTKFKFSKSITRPANTTQYAVSDLVNASSATTLIEIDFGTNNANRIIEIDKVQLTSDNGTASTKLSAGIHFFNTSTILSGGAVSQVDDNAAFAPSNAQVLLKMEGTFDTLDGASQIGTTNYCIYSSEKCEGIKLDANGKTWVAIVANNTYTPASGEIITVVGKGYILG